MGLSQVTEAQKETIFFTPTAINGQKSNVPIAPAIISKLEDYFTQFSSQFPCNYNLVLNRTSLQTTNVGVIDSMSGVFSYSSGNDTAAIHPFFTNLKFKKWKLKTSHGLFIECEVVPRGYNRIIPIELSWKKIVFKHNGPIPQVKLNLLYKVQMPCTIEKFREFCEDEFHLQCPVFFSCALENLKVLENNLLFAKIINMELLLNPSHTSVLQDLKVEFHGYESTGALGGNLFNISHPCIHYNTHHSSSTQLYISGRSCLVSRPINIILSDDHVSFADTFCLPQIRKMYEYNKCVQNVVKWKNLPPLFDHLYFIAYASASDAAFQSSQLVQLTFPAVASAAASNSILQNPLLLISSQDKDLIVIEAMQAKLKCGHYFSKNVYFDYVALSPSFIFTVTEVTVNSFYVTLSFPVFVGYGIQLRGDIRKNQVLNFERDSFSQLNMLKLLEICKVSVPSNYKSEKLDSQMNCSKASFNTVNFEFQCKCVNKITKQALEVVIHFGKFEAKLIEYNAEDEIKAEIPLVYNNENDAKYKFNRTIFQQHLQFKDCNNVTFQFFS